MRLGLDHVRVGLDHRRFGLDHMRLTFGLGLGLGCRLGVGLDPMRRTSTISRPRMQAVRMRAIISGVMSGGLSRDGCCASARGWLGSGLGSGLG